VGFLISFALHLQKYLRKSALKVSTSSPLCVIFRWMIQSSWHCNEGGFTPQHTMQKCIDNEHELVSMRAMQINDLEFVIFTWGGATPQLQQHTLQKGIDNKHELVSMRAMRMTHLEFVTFTWWECHTTAATTHLAEMHRQWARTCLYACYCDLSASTSWGHALPQDTGRCRAATRAQQICCPRDTVAGCHGRSCSGAVVAVDACRCCSVVQCDLVSCSVLQCVAVCWSVLQCVAVCCNVLQWMRVGGAVWCSVVQCGSVCCSVLQCGAVWCSVMQCDAVWCSVMQCNTVCCNMLQLYVGLLEIRSWAFFN